MELFVLALGAVQPSRVVVGGEVDASVAQQFRDQLLAQVATLDDRVVTVDLARLEFLDSCGLRALCDAVRATKAAGRDLRLVRPSAAVRRVIDLTGTAELLHLAQTDPAGASADARQP